jgi:hypothetical protein
VILSNCTHSEHNAERMRAKLLKNGAPGEIRTPDLQLRSVNQGDFNPMARLTFLQIRKPAFGGIPPVLLSSCSQATYILNTLTLIPREHEYQCVQRFGRFVRHRCDHLKRFRIIAKSAQASASRSARQLAAPVVMAWWLM